MVTNQQLLESLIKQLQILPSDQNSDWFKGYMAGRDAARRTIQKVSNDNAGHEGWIKCSDRMPDDDTYVVVANIGHGQIYEAVAAWYLHKSFRPMDGLTASNYDGGAVIDMDIDITHWQPLPKPPTDEAP